MLIWEGAKALDETQPAEDKIPESCLGLLGAVRERKRVCVEAPQVLLTHCMIFFTWIVKGDFIFRSSIFFNSRRKIHLLKNKKCSLRSLYFWCIRFARALLVLTGAGDFSRGWSAQIALAGPGKQWGPAGLRWRRAAGFDESGTFLWVLKGRSLTL